MYKSTVVTLSNTNTNVAADSKTMSQFQSSSNVPVDSNNYVTIKSSNNLAGDSGNIVLDDSCNNITFSSNKNLAFTKNSVTGDRTNNVS